MKVRATHLSKKFNIPIREVGRIVQPGEEFELSKKAFERLNGNGPSRLKLVEKVEEPVIEEKPKKARKKKVNETGDKK